MSNVWRLFEAKSVWASPARGSLLVQASPCVAHMLGLWRSLCVSELHPWQQLPCFLWRQKLTSAAFPPDWEHPHHQQGGQGGHLHLWGSKHYTTQYILMKRVLQSLIQVKKSSSWGALCATCSSHSVWAELGCGGTTDRDGCCSGQQLLNKMEPENSTPTSHKQDHDVTFCRGNMSTSLQGSCVTDEPGCTCRMILTFYSNESTTGPVMGQRQLRQEQMNRSQKFEADSHRFLHWKWSKLQHCAESMGKHCNVELDTFLTVRK